MPEKLSDVHKEGLEEERAILKDVRRLPSRLRAGIHTVHGILPTKEEKREYEKSIDALSSILDRLPVATYDVFLISQGNYHQLEIGISNLKESNKERLEEMVYDIFRTIEENSKWEHHWNRSYDRRDIEKVMHNLKKNKKDLEYFDRIDFGLYH